MKLRLCLLISAIAFLILVAPSLVSAQCCLPECKASAQGDCLAPAGDWRSQPCSALTECSPNNQPSGSGGTAGTQKLPNPLGTTSVYDIIGRVIKALLGLTGAIALVMFIYGGFLMMFSGGNPSTVKKGKDTLVMAVLGLVVIFASYAIVNFVITSITK